ncbi:hypothetical protein KUV80_11930 [Fictibacillus nanhaiensis]|uniref:hypothetical protein n=1 Tax=Fictibacillus nanhaiensis TaxID=742169 RepID=UPI001C95517E|nr:hypothetical protein [Fictibacillus nanhaiensis]MBY6037372.1 hypothetical protein [Fictibacillus nanhaiensis]
MKKAFFTSFLVLLVTACSPMESYKEEGAKTEPAAYEDKRDIRDNLFGHGIINYHLTKNEPRVNYSFDTNMNPSDYRSMNTTRFDLSDDQDLIRQAVIDASGINPQMVTINGNFAHIHVNVPDDLSKKERSALNRKIMNAVERAVPRYKFSLKLDH